MIDIYAQTEKNVKQFVMEQLNDAKKIGRSSFVAVTTRETIAYGALQFAVNYCFPSYNYDLEKWWKEEITTEFRKICE